MTEPPAIAALPRYRLFDGPSPLHRLRRFSAVLGGGADVWIKREDLLPLAFGGNKLRNLEFLVGAALADGADVLVTSGRRWSNHCRLTAAAGAAAGLPVHLVLTGPPISPPGANERLDRLLGAIVHVAETDARADREALVEEVLGTLQAEGRRPYVVPVGGSGAIGAAGQVLGGLELVGQARTLGMEPRAVVLPSATGGTQAGVLVGLRLGRLASRVVGIAVANPPAELVPVIAQLLRDLRPLAGVGVDEAEIHLDGAFLGPAYGVPTPAAAEAAELLARTEGILVDPIYTAKGLAGLVAGVRSGEFTGSIVFWHAGGTPGLFEMAPHDNARQPNHEKDPEPKPLGPWSIRRPRQMT
jgi:1-aminocyclopropane-1-carboxylate deaminase/D-cysteine desulfhydrase-like pyridoxal-dependent ACC family enzyme